MLGRAFVVHGVTWRVPVSLDAPATQTVHVMLHDDTGEIGRFEFGGSENLDPPHVRNGRPVVVSLDLP